LDLGSSRLCDRVPANIAQLAPKAEFGSGLDSFLLASHRNTQLTLDIMVDSKYYSDSQLSISCRRLMNSAHIAQRLDPALPPDRQFAAMLIHLAEEPICFRMRSFIYVLR